MSAKEKKDEPVGLHLDEKQLEKIEKARAEREKREEEEERRRNLEALEKFQEEQKKREKEEAEEKKAEEEEEEPEITPAVKNISLVFLLVATILGWIVSAGMIGAEIYIVMHFKLHFCCWILIVLQVLLIIVGTIARWLNWFVKTRKVVPEEGADKKTLKD